MVLHGRSDLVFTYIPAHLYYCMFELIKNSLRAVAEHHGVHTAMPPIKARRRPGPTPALVRVPAQCLHACSASLHACSARIRR